MGQRRLFYGWVVLGASATMVCVALGAMFSLAVFFKPIEDTMGWSRTGISTIALLNWLFMGLGSFLWGALSDRVGTRVVAVAGGLLLGLGLVLSSQVSALWQLYVSFGVMVGFGAGAFYAPLSATATRWFTRRRGLAVALVSSGIGFGILIVAPAARLLVSLYGWRAAMMILGDVAWLVIVPVALLIRNAPGDIGAVAMGGGADAPRPPRGREWSTREVLRSPQFWVISVTHFACCSAHSGPIFHMVTHAIDQGIPRMAAATILGISGLSSVGGRLGAGALADRFGAKRTLISGLLLQAVMISLYLFARDATAFFELALVFGTAYGAVMPLYALVTREYFGERVMGAAYGGVFFISTIGMGFGSFAGGFIYDHLGTYAWLYIGSTLIGMAAVLLALAFRAPRSAGVGLPVTAAAR